MLIVLVLVIWMLARTLYRFHQRKNPGHHLHCRGHLIMLHVLLHLHPLHLSSIDSQVCDIIAGHTKQQQHEEAADV